MDILEAYDLLEENFRIKESHAFLDGELQDAQAATDEFCSRVRQLIEKEFHSKKVVNING